MTTSNGSVVLRLEDFAFWFKPPAGEQEGPAALDAVTFDIETGSFVLILGRSGSGKSTLALNLVGIYPDYFGGRNSGRVSINFGDQGLTNRRELDRSERFKQVNMLFQNPEDQIVTLTVEEEVAFALENYLVPRGEIHLRIDRALDLVGLTGFRERSTLKLSGGEKQRVALAAMLALEPRVLILDEPTSNLDPAGTADVLETIDRVRSLIDITVVVIEHEVDEVFDRVDVVLLVEDQRVVGPMSPRDFITEQGLHVRDGMGLWIPQACEVGLELRQRGVALPRVPLNGVELVDDLREFAPDLIMRAAAAPRPSAAPVEAVDRPIAIEVKDVRFAYPDGPEVLQGVSLLARHGELLAICGQNGSGKSTLASLLNGISQPTAGTVLVEGRATVDYRFEELVKRVAYIFQVPEKQFVTNSVHGEIIHGLKGLGLSAAEIEERATELLDRVRLLDRRDASPYVLSHGQKRRLSVAAMVVGKPDVVVLDEPTFGQDYHQALNLMDLLSSLADEGAAVVFITHDMRLVAEYADRAAVVCDGTIIFEGRPVDLFADGSVLRQARLRPPAVFEFSRQILGSPVLTTPELTDRLLELIHA